MPADPHAQEQKHVRIGYLKQRLAEPHPFSFVRGGEVMEVAGRYQVAVNEGQTYLAAGLAGHGILQAPYFRVRP